MKLRFPPSPTGHLHVGNVRTALYNWLLARRHDGSFLLRIEDTDVARSTRENEEMLIEDLRWLGLKWDEGPAVGGDNGPYRQSERVELYRERIDDLMGQGAAYYCFCTPEELEEERQRALAEKRPPRYSGKCRNIDPDEAKSRVENGEAGAIRFKVEEGDAIKWEDEVHGLCKFEREVIGDFVFVRSDGMPAYNFAVVVDDALMSVTHVVRGDDHISNTPRQIMLYRALGFDEPKFGHLPMILGPDGSRLSKRHGATSVQQFRDRGYLPDAFINFLALLGWNPGTEQEIFSRDELIKQFSLERVNRSAAIFNFEKLDWLNGQYMRSITSEDLLPHVQPFLAERGMLPNELSEETRALMIDLVDTFNSGSSLLEIAEGAEMAFDFEPVRDFETEETKAVLAEPDAQKVIGMFRDELSALDVLDADSFKAAVKNVGKSAGVKGKALFQPVRLAVTGKTAGPELAKLVPLLEAGSRLELPRRMTSVRERVAAACEHLRIA